MLKKPLFLLSVLLTTSLGAGCATSGGNAQIAPEAFVKPRKTIAAVDQMEPEMNPKAKLYLHMAKEEVERADRAFQRGDTAQARLALLRAESDAQLALALVEEAQVQEEAEALEAEIDRKQDEMRLR